MAGCPQLIYSSIVHLPPDEYMLSSCKSIQIDTRINTYPFNKRGKLGGGGTMRLDH